MDSPSDDENGTNHDGILSPQLMKHIAQLAGEAVYTTRSQKNPMRTATLSGKPVGSKLATPASQGSILVVPAETYTFPLGVGGFAKLRKRVYIDKTQFTGPISEKEVVLLCRPRRSGETLTVGMLQKFHGVESRGEYERLFG